MSPPATGSAADQETPSAGESDELIRAPGRPRDERASRAIMEAAMRQLDDVGYAGISMEGVASEAGVARATIYRRYRDKADLITSAIAEYATEIPTRPSEDPKADLCRFLVDFDHRFGASGMGVLGALMTNRDDPRALELHRERVVAPRVDYGRRLLEQARANGELRRDADLDLAFQMLSGSVFHRRVAGVAADPGWAERAVDAIWQGMGPQPTPDTGEGARPTRATGGGARRRSP
ncbi:MAG TPA: TetR/AcrR family transcriptional regulator [Acidimicrobiales bacterium]|nr:TetR/AcrR family transcriptional regulator [Acidimicrobiales bacterium]